jgi:hypothetical protein
MTTDTNTAAAPARFRDALRDNGLSTLAMVLVVGVAVAGWSASFISLHDFALAHMGFRTSKPAWLVPSTFDGAALGLSLLSFRAAIYGRASVGSMLYVYAFTALSSWINWVHIDDKAGGKFVSALLPIAAVIVFGKVLKEAREAYERRHGKQVFRVRPGLLVLRWMADRRGTRAAIRGQVLAIPVEALIGLGAGALARDAVEAMQNTAGTVDAPAAAAAVPVVEQVDAPAQAAPRIPQRAVVDARAPITVEVDEDVDASTGSRVDTETAKALMAAGWLSGEPATLTAAKSGRSKSLVYREFKSLDERYGPRPRLDDTGEIPLVTSANGTAH